MVQRTDYSGSTSSVHLHPTARRVRFKCDDTGANQHRVTLMNHRHAVSSEDIRLTPKRSTHRVEFQIPIHRGTRECVILRWFHRLIADTHPWLHVDVSSPAKTRSLTSQKIDIKPSAQNSIRVHRIPSFVEVDTTVHSVSNSSTEQTSYSSHFWFLAIAHHSTSAVALTRALCLKARPLDKHASSSTRRSMHDYNQ